jgi:hypothetical protein
MIEFDLFLNSIWGSAYLGDQPLRLSPHQQHTVSSQGQIHPIPIRFQLEFGGDLVRTSLGHVFNEWLGRPDAGPVASG